MALAPRDRPHLHVEGGGRTEPYTSPRIVITGLPPARARAAHAAKLKRAVDRAITQAREQIADRQESIAEGAAGFYLQFEIPIGHQSALDSLENKPKAIELVAVRPSGEGDETISATVFVPESSADFYDKRIEAYRAQQTKSGKPKNENLIARIDDVQLGTTRSLFTDDMTLFPRSDEPVWWEVWLRDGRLQAFQDISARLNIVTRAHTIATYPTYRCCCRAATSQRYSIALSRNASGRSGRLGRKSRSSDYAAFRDSSCSLPSRQRGGASTSTNSARP